MSQDNHEGSVPFTQRIVSVFLRGNLSVLFIILSLAVGAIALLVTPREEEPQIVVPVADVLISVPGASAQEVEKQVATRLEKLLYQIDGVEYVYSVSRPGMAVVTARFYVGQDRERSLIKLYNKIYSNQDLAPPIVAGWVVKPVEIDDVPIINLTFTSCKLDEFALRRIAEEAESRVQSVPNTGRTYIVGGQPRRALVHLDSGKLAAYGLAISDIERALKATNVSLPAGSFAQGNQQYLVTVGEFIRTTEELRRLVVGVVDNRPVYLSDVATITDGADEPESYCRIRFGPAAHFSRIIGNARAVFDAPTTLSLVCAGDFPAVTLAVAKKKGTNAVWVARAVERAVEEMRGSVIPDDVQVVVTRDYGETANDKVNELVDGLLLAIATVIALLALTLGWREAFIVAVAIPIVYSLTLIVNYMFGYTINRVTLFALILALGLLVDDPIVDVENIYRHLKMRKRPPLDAVLFAVNEVRPPVILATFAVIVSFLPMFFITGMMGPYMRPMAVNVPLAMLMSLVVALTITPWMSYHILKKEAEHASQHAAEHGGHALHEEAEGASPLLTKWFTATLLPFLRHRWMRWALALFIVGMMGFSGLLVLWRKVPLKMLPFDNKNEFQVVVDMPEDTPLEKTAAAADALARYLATVPEVVNVTTYVGVPSPVDFNGLIRQYYFRTAPYYADIRVNLAPKKKREMQSHGILLRLRKRLEEIGNANGALVKLVEVPPGPPVVATITAEIYGEPGLPYSALQESAEQLRQRLAREEAVVDTDSTVEADQPKYVFVVDREKAALSGVSVAEIASTLAAFEQGYTPSMIRSDHEVNPFYIKLRLPRADRSSIERLAAVYVRGMKGNLVQLGEIGKFVLTKEDQSIYHKNLNRVAYVFAETAGRAPAEVILGMQSDLKKNPLPKGTWAVWTGEGEWKITVDVFRDLGLAFAAALFGIYILLVYNTGSYLMPVIIMLSIPLTIIGIMPGFWLLNAISARPVGGFENPVFFTATAMIGMIALAGIVVRNSIILIDFIHIRLSHGVPLWRALVDSVAVRARPIFLTAGAAMLGAWPITLDPIFSGLAWSLIFGLFVSTAFTLLVIPVVYWAVYAKRADHDALPQSG
ncbi:MAG: efflux RND transporter permease subunit [Candidatus Hydrogenedentota bacterium]|jgi:multidrug efflux pump subunit AcrB|uniref:Acriflavin resistance protein n=1 Tax=Sumerlaea chitinivorans TaxID=2250252 RepID=A0A2Z4Y5J0_SUMC1|nr:Acriflavin resistance protein [Candidatus Sumerlaea chitinivorans]RMH26266.1 MAG: efflux RND transporter permease subunit [Candidatus Hydrogenedentota bacterium]